MTRINTVDPSLLADQHLFAEYRELPRIFTAVRKGKAKGKPGTFYTMGTGHVTFFYDKLDWLFCRYYLLVDELRSRGYKINYIQPDDLWIIGENWNSDWVPSHRDLQVNCERLLDKLNTQPSLTYKKGPVDVLRAAYEGILNQREAKCA